MPTKPKFHHQSPKKNYNVEILEKPLPKPPSTADILQHESYDRAPITRWLVVTGLLFSYVAGVLRVVFGSGAVLKPTKSAASRSYHNTWGKFFHNWPQLNLTPVTAEFLPLVGNTIITLLGGGGGGSMGMIHSTTLRWALGDELTFNSNLRLFTFAGQRHISLGKVSNLLHTIFILLYYAASSLVFAQLPSDTFLSKFP
ncbi:hypothetical protein NUU61_001231 [Penicillium alfredii]|uniref:Uncharacterized protein n=1 Tax=Penicillium alfredii TaxID=1506179 RepID=A0A9W9KRN5_9EURO|nr:uncharacterized protein NUU61_001231 [Penicillium alfredii]KAJ5115472.1 hypothetical protein NUU61_001231 [Penicillium alfredii]